MAMTSSHCDHMELTEEEEDVKPRVATARRNLFGPVDHQQLHQDYQKFMHMSLEMAKQRWSFDFESDHPVPGSVEWEQMQCQDVPKFYHSRVVRSDKRGQEIPISTAGAYSDDKLEERAEVPLADKYRQATITDFFTAKKRSCLHHKVSSRQ